MILIIFIVILLKNISYLYYLYYKHTYIIIYVTGRFNLTVDDTEGTWDLTGHVINDTWIVEHFRTFPSIKKLVLYLDGLFEGKELSKYNSMFLLFYFICIELRE